MNHVLEVSNLKKRYGDLVAVDGVSFNVTRGEVFGILGPNGAGKTTTLEMIETLRPIDSGRVLLDGLDVQQEPQKVKQRIGVQLQASSFFDKLSLTELLLLAQVATRLLLLLTQILMMVGAGVLFFNLHFVGSIFNMIIVGLLGGVVFLAIGFALSGISKSEDQVAPLANIITLPMMMLSGVFFSCA